MSDNIRIGSNYVEIDTVIKNRCGIYDRPASILVQAASKYNSNIQYIAKGKTIDAKSILFTMSLGLLKGDEITIRAKGADAEAAVKELAKLIDSKFGEDDSVSFGTGYDRKFDESMIKIPALLDIITGKGIFGKK